MYHTGVLHNIEPYYRLLLSTLTTVYRLHVHAIPPRNEIQRMRNAMRAAVPDHAHIHANANGGTGHTHNHASSLMFIAPSYDQTIISSIPHASYSCLSVCVPTDWCTACLQFPPPSTLPFCLSQAWMIP